MLPLILSVLLPGLILANSQCLSGDMSCPEGKTCCTVDDKPSCCDQDPGGELPLRATLPYSNSSTNAVLQNGTWFIDCSIFNCNGTCCYTGYSGCCPFKRANCCTGPVCCEMGKQCCGHGCCPRNTACCYGITCCKPSLTCCGTGCCPSDSPKCCGSWCCKRNEKCGLSHKSCYSAAATMAPTAAVVSVVVLWWAVKMASRT